MKKIIATFAVTLALAGCGGRGGEEGAPVAAAPSPSPSRTDPGVTGCLALQALGTGGTADQYRGIAAQIAGTGDAKLSAQAVVLHVLTGNSLDPVDTRDENMKMLDAVLDTAEECLRAVG